MNIHECNYLENRPFVCQVLFTGISLFLTAWPQESVTWNTEGLCCFCSLKLSIKYGIFFFSVRTYLCHSDWLNLYEKILPQNNRVLFMLVKYEFICSIFLSIAVFLNHFCTFVRSGLEFAKQKSAFLKTICKGAKHHGSSANVIFFVKILCTYRTFRYCCQGDTTPDCGQGVPAHACVRHSLSVKVKLLSYVGNITVC